MQQSAKQQPAFSLDDILNSATVSKSTKEKSKVPVLPVGDNVKKLVTEIRRLKAEYDDAKSMFELKEKELLDLVIPEREKLCLQQGYVSSIKIPSSDNLSVRISWKDQYTKIGLETVPMLEGIIKDRFQQFFTTDMVITVKNNSESALNELIQESVRSASGNSLRSRKQSSHHQDTQLNSLQRLIPKNASSYLWWCISTNQRSRRNKEV